MSCKEGRVDPSQRCVLGHGFGSALAELRAVPGFWWGLWPRAPRAVKAEWLVDDGQRPHRPKRTLHARHDGRPTCRPLGGLADGIVPVATTVSVAVMEPKDGTTQLSPGSEAVSACEHCRRGTSGTWSSWDFRNMVVVGPQEHGRRGTSAPSDRPLLGTLRALRCSPTRSSPTRSSPTRTKARRNLQMQDSQKPWTDQRGQGPFVRSRCRRFGPIPTWVHLVMPTPAKTPEPSGPESTQDASSRGEGMSTPAGEVDDLRKLAEEEGATVTPDVSPCP
jgi:hypothetical protein